MFKDAALTDVDLLKKTWSEWNNMNWVRTGILLIGVSFSALSLHRVYSFAGQRKQPAPAKKDQLSNKVAIG